MSRCIFFVIAMVFFSCYYLKAQPKKEHNLVFDSLAKRWDEAIPLGNGWIGALIWQKNDKLRMSLDRVDLWDDRPMPEIDKLKFSWVVEQVRKGEYDTVQKIGDDPYEKYPAPTKIPGAALEFDLSKIGKVVSNELDIKTGLAEIKFKNGVVFRNYIHATNHVGYFGFENLEAKDIIPELIIPNYNTGRTGTTGSSVEGIGLERIGYKKGSIAKTHNSIRYHQPTWKGNYYEVLVKWYNLPGNKLIGQWTITNNRQAQLQDPNFTLKEPTGWPTHSKWWNDYWSRSSVSLPDKQLERQYYLEMYKFACVARSNTPPISLQAIWTADNGNLPPWKGDFHHDLNTQLSYWPGYTGNHLDLTASYTNWLWKVKEENKRWTRNYFELPGLNVPGVTTISGKPMGGWIQYSMSPTISAWLAQHFYWQAIYSMDKIFFDAKASTYLREVYSFLDSYLAKNERDSSFIALSSSPEYYDNSIKAWFTNMTNYDKALIKSIKRQEEKLFNKFWRFVPPRIIPGKDYIEELEYYDYNETGLTVAPGQNLDTSHRHMSPYMAIYPLCLLDIDNDKEKTIIENSLKQIESKGTSQWVGYSFSWMACIYARARQAEKAVNQLQIFSSNFCSPNSFHLNGDQKGGQYSSFTYRPFTLEGNFAFAQGVHELLLQTRNGAIEIFPAVPESWKDVSFKTLRAEGAFLVSAAKENGVPSQVSITAEQGGRLRIKQPFKTFYFTNLQKKYKMENNVLEVEMKKGETITIKNGYE
jgi:alpha-L-fucosidase 2